MVIILFSSEHLIFGFFVKKNLSLCTINTIDDILFSVNKHDVPILPDVRDVTTVAVIDAIPHIFTARMSHSGLNVNRYATFVLVSS